MATTFTLFLLVMMLGCGAYAIFTAIKLKTKGYLFSSRLLYPGNCNPSDCTDDVGFMVYTFPRLLIFGIACILLGAVIGLNEFVNLGLPEWLSMYVIPFIGLPLFAWYIYVQNKASKLFW